MISLNDKLHVEKPAPTYRIEREARNAAVATIGPHARRGFEYETRKVDGRWRWWPNDEIKAPTPAEIKAMGGKRGLLSLVSNLASPCHGDPSHIEPSRTIATGSNQGTPMARIDDETIKLACNGLDIATDPLAIPGFLKRDAKPKSQSVGPEAMDAIKRMENPAGARGKAAGKPNVKDKVDGPKTEKRTSEAPTKTAEVSSGKFATKAALIKAGISAGHDDDKIVKDVNKDFPGCNYLAKDVKWYRRKMQ